MTCVRLLNRGFLIAPNLPPRFLGNLFFRAMLVPLTKIYSCAGFVVFKKNPWRNLVSTLRQNLKLVSALHF